MARKRRLYFGVLFACTALASWGCAAKAKNPSPTNLANKNLATIEENTVPLGDFETAHHVRMPQASGTVVYENSRATIDASHIDQGYVMVKYNGSQKKIKVQVIKDGITYTYNLNNRNAYETFPLSEGNGTYAVLVWENVTGNQYVQVYNHNISVTLSDEFGPFLTPNQYVNFTQDSAAAQIAAQLSASAADQIGVVTNVYNYVTDHIAYDKQKAENIQSGYLPDIDQTISSGQGICFDYASVMAAMLRSQNIPTKLVIGYSGSIYHAWVDVYIDNIGWVNNYIYFDGKDWSLMDPTFASFGGNSDTVKQYIKNAANYQGKYSY